MRRFKRPEIEIHAAWCGDPHCQREGCKDEKARQQAVERERNQRDEQERRGV